MEHRLKIGWATLHFQVNLTCWMVGFAVWMNCVQFAFGPLAMHITVDGIDGDKSRE